MLERDVSIDPYVNSIGASLKPSRQGCTITNIYTQGVSENLGQVRHLEPLAQSIDVGTLGA